MSEKEIHLAMKPVDTLCYKVTTESGIEFFVEAKPGFGGIGNNPNPLAHFLGALGGCTSIKTQLGLEKRGEKCESVSVDIRGIQKDTPPQVFENIHLSFTVKGNLDDSIVQETINKVVTLTCPIAVMVGRAVPISWDFRIVKE